MVMEVSKEPTKPTHMQEQVHINILCQSYVMPILYLVLMFSSLIFTRKFNPDAH